MRASLTKWYLDVTCDDGSCVIGYAATLDLEGWSLAYASLLEAPEGSAARVESTLRAAPFPTEDGASYVWSAPELAARGRWEPLDAPVSATLLQTEEGAVRWDCRAPRARASVDVGGRRYEGLGYVEVLSVGIAPWRLPLRELRWGRALSEDRSAVWIDWRADAHHRRWLWIDGRPADLGSVTEEGLFAPDGTPLGRFVDNRVLRSGAVGSTALSILGRAARDRLPARALLLDETKWCARSLGLGAPGRCIHEVVLFP